MNEEQIQSLWNELTFLESIDERRRGNEMEIVSTYNWANEFTYDDDVDYC